MILGLEDTMKEIEEAKDLHAQLVKQAKQIKELKAEAALNGVFITKQIDAAWYYVARDECDYGNGYVEEALKELGIVRCKRCDGNGPVGVTTKAEILAFKSRWPGIDLGSASDSACHGCNDHKWTKEKANE